MTSIDYPWPPKQLTPNAKRRNHWRVAAKHTAVYRKICFWLTKQARVRVDPGLVPMTITFFPPDRRRRDRDGIIGAFKAGQDGLADALCIDDHAFRPTYCFGDPVADGLVRVMIHELAS